MKTPARLRLAVVFVLPPLAGGVLFVACGGGLDPEASPEVCEGGACEGDASSESSSSVDGGFGADVLFTAKDGARDPLEAGRDASDGGRDASDSGWDAPPLAPCDDGGLPGMLDPTFGDAGAVYVNADPTSSYGNAVIVQSDGKVLLAGAAGETADPTGQRFVLVRLAAGGVLDTGFGDGGIATTAFPAGKGGGAEAVALAADGRILAGGNVYVGPASTDFAIARYSAGGVLDGTFGDGGVAFAGFGPPEGGGVTAIAVFPDGHVLAAGYRGLAAGVMSNDNAVAKFNANGSLDTTFGVGGRVKVDVRSTNDATSAMAVQSDGKILLVGASGRPPTDFPRDLTAVRLNADGSLDPSWGLAGKAVHIFGTGASGAGSVFVETTGRVVLGGPIRGTTTDVAIFRLTATGAPDATFGSGGVVSTDFGGADLMTAAYLRPDGKIVQVGRCLKEPAPFTFGFSRYQPDGAPDLGFGSAGKIVSERPSSFGDRGAAFTGDRATLVGRTQPGGAFTPWMMGAVRYCL